MSSKLGAKARALRVARLLVAAPVVLSACASDQPPEPASQPLSAIVLTPSSASLAVGGTLQFSANGRMSDGSTLTVAVTYAGTGGTLGPGGLYTAGQVPGTYSVIATQSGGALADTALVTIVGGQPTTTLSPGQDIQNAVDAHPAGTAFLLQAGVHRLQTIRPKAGNSFTGEPGAILSGARQLTAWTASGSLWVAEGQTQQGTATGVCARDAPTCQLPEDLFIDDVLQQRVGSLAAVGAGRWYFDYDANRLYLGSDPSGHVVEVGVLPFAFTGTASNVTIRGLVIEKYATPAQSSAIFGYGSSGWLVENNEIRWNHGAGTLTANNWIVRANHIHHNGQLGVHPQTRTSGALIEDNEIDHNNTAGFSVDWEAGGVKAILTADLTMRNNWVHHNTGNGLWCDNCFATTRYEGNRVEDNGENGIYHEVSADAVIVGNTCLRNGLARGNRGGIWVDNSGNVDVSQNTLDGNGDGIKLRQVSRPEFAGRVLQNVWVHENRVTVTRNSTGLVQFVGDNSYFTTRNNRFTDNIYVSVLPAPFAWNNQLLTLAEWHAAGQD